jgi:hypothetical protein
MRLITSSIFRDEFLLKENYTSILSILLIHIFFFFLHSSNALRFFHSAHSSYAINELAMRDNFFLRFQQLLLTLKGLSHEID